MASPVTAERRYHAPQWARAGVEVILIDERVVEAGAPPVLLTSSQFYAATDAVEMRRAAEAGALAGKSADPYGGGGGSREGTADANADGGGDGGGEADADEQLTASS